MPTLRRTRRLALTAFMIAVASTVSAQDRCRQISADVVAFDHAFYNNRFGTLQQGGMMLPLRSQISLHLPQHCRCPPVGLALS